MTTEPASGPTEDNHRFTRTGVVWTAVAVALVLFVLLIILILQNQDQVRIHYLGLEGTVPVGVALFIAAVGGGILVAIAGGARILQLRAQRHRRERPIRPPRA